MDLTVSDEVVHVKVEIDPADVLEKNDYSEDIEEFWTDEPGESFNHATDKQIDPSKPWTSGTQGRKRKFNGEGCKFTEEEITSILMESDDIFGDDSSSDCGLESGNGDESDDDGWDTSCRSLSVPHPELESSGSFSERRPSRPPMEFFAAQGLLERPPGKTPIDYFNLFFTDNLIQTVLTETNNNAVNLLLASQGHRVMITDFKEISKRELEIFFALVFLMGLVQVPSVQDYWRQLENIFNFPSFYNNMSRDRFQLILRCLHFVKDPGEGEPPPQDPLYKVRPVVDFFSSKMKTIYYPGRDLSLSFHQHFQNQHHKHGIKFFRLTEPTGLVLDVLIYAGAKDSELGGKGHADKVVLKLMERYLYKGHSLYMDSYCTSVDLATELFNKYYTYTTGSLKKFRKGNPSLVEKKLKHGESVQMFTEDGVCVVKWQHKRDVLMLSSKFSGDPVEVKLRSGKVAHRPQMVVEYRSRMGGGDKTELLPCYSLEGKSQRWYVKVGLHLFQIMMNNASIIYNTYSGQTLPLKEFQISIILSLLRKHKKPNVEPPAVSTGIHIPEYLSKPRQKRCRVCYGKGQRKMVKTICPSCPETPGLCLGQCFRQFHNY